MQFRIGPRDKILGDYTGLVRLTNPMFRCESGGVTGKRLARGLLCLLGGFPFLILRHVRRGLHLEDRGD